ncbi:hypothetical protein MNV49_004491 [Pseudohyphozyma bogoriensis]|nr:hypothetical protein MNV49_004491 [Pseudohyphozyma bogoriensis]
MRSLEGLPQELIDKILEHTVEEHQDPRNLEGGASRRATLRSTALVAPRWTQPSQRLLWEILLVSSQDKVDSLLDSPVLGVYRTTTLCLSRYRPAPQDIGRQDRCPELFSHLRGIQYLIIKKCEVDPTLFQSQALSSLTRLDLSKVDDLSSAHPCPQLPLRTLTIHSGVFRTDALVSSLASSCHSLTSLTLHLTTINSNLPSILSPTATSTLTSLTLTGRFTGPPATLTRFYASCTNLRRLAAQGEPSFLLPALKAQLPITLLCIYDLNEDSESPMVDALLSLMDGHAFPNLDCLDIQTIFVQDGEVRDVLRESCLKRLNMMFTSDISETRVPLPVTTIQRIDVFSGSFNPHGVLASLISASQHSLTDFSVYLSQTNSAIITILLNRSHCLTNLAIKGHFHGDPSALARLYNNCTTLEHLELQTSVHSHASRPPTTMPTIQTLPPELLSKILELAINEFELQGPLDGDGDQRRREFLRSTSLVARSWRDASQRLLCDGLAYGDELHLYSADDGYRPFKYTPPTNVLLKKLVISGGMFRPDGIVPSLLHTSRHSLTDLHLTLTPDNAPALAALSCVARTLKTLKLAGHFREPPNDLVNFYNSCTALRILHLQVDHDVSLLEPLLSTIIHAPYLTLIQITNDEILSRIVTELVSGPSFPNLKRLELKPVLCFQGMGLLVPMVLDHKLWEGLWEACLTRRVVVEPGVDFEARRRIRYVRARAHS